MVYEVDRGGYKYKGAGAMTPHGPTPLSSEGGFFLNSEYSIIPGSLKSGFIWDTLYNELYFRDGDEVWDVPVVVYCVLTVVLIISSFILLSCLNRETKKFKKKISRPETKVKYCFVIFLDFSC